MDHATINRWVVKFSPMLMRRSLRHRRPVGKSWRMDETYIRVRGQMEVLVPSHRPSLPRVCDRAGPPPSLDVRCHHAGGRLVMDSQLADKCPSVLPPLSGDNPGQGIREGSVYGVLIGH